MHNRKNHHCMIVSGVPCNVLKRFKMRSKSQLNNNNHNHDSVMTQESPDGLEDEGRDCH